MQIALAQTDLVSQSNVLEISQQCCKTTVIVKTKPLSEKQVIYL